MTARTQNMEQTATYWAPGTNDGFGNVGFSAPVSINVRWEQKQQLFRDEQANEVVSSAIVYTDQAVVNKGYLYLGTSIAATPIGLDGAYEIRATGSSSNLRNSEVLYKAWL